MIRFLLVIHLMFAAHALCGEFRFGPRFGVLTPGEIVGVSTRPGPGLYWGTAFELQLSSLLALECAAGASLGMAEPRGEQTAPDRNHDADYFGTDLSLSASQLFLSLAAGPSFYYYRMDWQHVYGSSGSEWNTFEMKRFGYHVSISVNPVQNVDLSLTLHFPEHAGTWSVWSITWMPLGFQLL